MIEQLSGSAGSFEHRWRISGPDPDSREFIVCDGWMNQPQMPDPSNEFHITIANTIVGPGFDIILQEPVVKRQAVIPADETLAETYPEPNPTGSPLGAGIKCVLFDDIYGAPFSSLAPGRLELTVEGGAGLGLYHLPPGGAQWSRVSGSIPVTAANFGTFQVHATSDFTGEATVRAKFYHSGSELWAEDTAVLYAVWAELHHVDEVWAPGSERMNVIYSIMPTGAVAPNAQLEVYRDDDPDSPVFVDSSIPKTGANVHYFQGAEEGWNGIMNAGPAAGQYILPYHQNYEVTVNLVPALALLANAPPKKPSKWDIASIDIQVDVNFDGGPNDNGNIFYMNDPERAFPVTSEVKLNGKGGVQPAKLPVPVTWTFEDPGGGNCMYDTSFQYEPGKYLGKRGLPGAVYWSADVSNTVFDANLNKSIASTQFKPSAVGDDDFKLKASVLDGAAVIKASAPTGSIEVWRYVIFHAKLYEMDGVSHISNKLSLAAVKAKFVGAQVRVILPEGETNDRALVQKLSPIDSVEHLGLYRPNPQAVTAADKQKDWTQLSRRIPRNPPATIVWNGLTLDVATEAEEAGDTVVQTAHKAQAWMERLENENFDSLIDWYFDYPQLRGTIVGVKKMFPKHDRTSPLAITDLWPVFKTPPIGPYLYGTFIEDPDSWWSTLHGLTVPSSEPGILVDQVIVIPELAALDGILNEVIAHEIGHYTKYVFHRRLFSTTDASDHTDGAGQGLMAAGGGQDVKDFSQCERRVLRGWKQ